MTWIDEAIKWNKELLESNKKIRSPQFTEYLLKHCVEGNTKILLSARKNNLLVEND